MCLLRPAVWPAVCWNAKGRQRWQKRVGLQCCDLHNNRSVWMMLKLYQGEADSLQVVDQSSTEGVIPGGSIEG